MTAECDDSRDLARRARQVTVACQQIETALAHRPGALSPGEDRTVLDMLNHTTNGIPSILYADPGRQITVALAFLRLWQSLLTEQADLLDQADSCWSDPDDEEH